VIAVAIALEVMLWDLKMGEDVDLGIIKSAPVGVFCSLSNLLIFFMSAGLEIVNYIFLAILLILFTINALSFTLDDTSTGEISRRQEWYRFQRSSKAWV
jgi:hypothetical protein